MASTPPARGGYPSRWFLLLAIARPVLTVAVLVVGYYLLPSEARSGAVNVLLLVAELAVVVLLLGVQVRLILRSRHPTMQGVQALALIIALFLLAFAHGYYLLAMNARGSFSADLSKTDAVYFAMTVFATVGFGDIVPASQEARVVVTFQMVGNLLILGLVLKVIVSAVDRVRQREH
ncbi:hypothetical protein BAY61_14845 [Prauserella marina]|uniref:Ion channel n=1 Tax=Prauserella marina TaxID=530584 RepID=A0A222VQ65_9PSEU|nr:potassium channel family protein [Prauserella marina]ASR36069.1 hypothetical protein BAY61_14845 [Prauserella marina]PWV76796.1 ion channel [Prauserella marina]SDC97820.1 Ion channel [Prauserella marina]